MKAILRKNYLTKVIINWSKMQITLLINPSELVDIVFSGPAYFSNFRWFCNDLLEHFFSGHDWFIAVGIKQLKGQQKFMQRSCSLALIWNTFIYCVFYKLS